MMNTLPLQNHHLPQAGHLCAQAYAHLRQAVPILPDRYERPESYSELLAGLLNSGAGLALVEDGELLGFLGWIYVDRFRETSRKAAYCPVWAHAAVKCCKAQVYSILYSQAAAEWTKAGCQVHAITVLAHDGVSERFWFWNGFGLTVVDAVRALSQRKGHLTDIPAGLAQSARPPAGYSIRKAKSEDLDELVRLESEHWAYYLEPPTLMVPQSPRSHNQMSEQVAGPVSSVWAAWQGNRLAAFITFTTGSTGGAYIINDESTIAINGAFTRPEFRGRGLGSSILAAACDDYQGRGFTRCLVDFESFNPRATAFWLKYFEPVCLSLIRVPERFEQASSVSHS